jgi:hypothetical protein
MSLWIALAWLAMPLFCGIGAIRSDKGSFLSRLFRGILIGLLIGFLAGCALAFEHWFGYSVFWILFAFSSLVAIGPLSSTDVSAPDNSQAVDESAQASSLSNETAQTNSAGRLPISSQKKLRKLNHVAKVPTKKAIYQKPLAAKSSAPLKPFSPSKKSKSTHYSLNEVRQISFDYIDSAGNLTSRDVSVNKLDGIYLQAYCLSKQARRTFKLDNICGLITLRETGELLNIYEWEDAWRNS